MPKKSESFSVLFAKICLVIVSYTLIYFTYLSLTSPIAPGDSIGYHIPIAKSIIDGSFLNPRTHEFAVNPVMYYPGSAEAILSLFMLFGIPLNLYNILALLCLFISCYLLGKQFFSDKSLSVIFASSIVTLPIMMQWVVTQFVDYWLAVFFVLLIYLLQKPKRSLRYIVILGLCSGFLIGTKYSGPFILFILFCVYYKQVLSFISFKNVIVFGVVTFFSGGFWYLRNAVFTGNPYFPQNLFATDKDFLKFKVFDSITTHPFMMFDALLSQYAAWALSILVVPVVFYLVYYRLNKKNRLEMVKLFLLVVLNFIVFGILPSEPGSYTHYISTYRYSLTWFIPLILITFLLAQAFKKYVLLYVFVIITMLSTPQLSFHPKIIFILLPIAYIIGVYPKVTGRYLSKYL